jgi:hypothetical protein
VANRSIPSNAPDRNSPLVIYSTAALHSPNGRASGILRAVNAQGVNEPAELRNNRQWRMAVWALRVGYLALALTVVGIVVMSSGSTPWVLALGVIVWLIAAAVTLTGVFRARSELAEPRPGFWPMRWMLLHDTVHVRSSV